jgi:hypothetical protein
MSPVALRIWPWPLVSSPTDRTPVTVDLRQRLHVDVTVGVRHLFHRNATGEQKRAGRVTQVIRVP